MKLDLAKYVEKICIGHRILLPRVILPSATYCNLQRTVFDNMLGKQLHSYMAMSKRSYKARDKF